MTKGVTFKVLFIGYMAQVQDARRDVCATLDFVSGYVTLHADGGQVSAPRIADLKPFVASLGQNIDELKKKSGEECREIEFSVGNNTLHVEPDADVNQVIRQLTERCSETGKVLRQALKSGLKIKRRPYHKYTDEIEETGICRVVFHGVGVFENKKLSFRPDGREILSKSTGTGKHTILGESTGSAEL
jgi:hypothetical protein